MKTGVKKLYTSVINILHFWNQINTEGDTKNNGTIFIQTLKVIRAIDVQNLHKIILDWKYLKKSIKYYYPTSKIWNSKKKYYSLLYELIDILEKHHNHIEKCVKLDEFIVLEKKKKRKLSLRFLKPRINLRYRSFQTL